MSSSAPAAAPAPQGQTDPYAGIDAAALTQGFVRDLPDGEREAWIAIDGMVCAACAQTIEAALHALPGVKSARVGLMTQRARVIWQGQSQPPSAFFHAIARTGYQPYPAGSAEFEDARRQSSRLLLWRLIVAAGAMMQVMMYAVPEYVAAPGDIDADVIRLLRWAQWMLTVPVMLFCATPILGNAWRSLRGKRIGMDVPASLGILLAFGASTQATFEGGGEVWFESVTMFVFFLLLARWLEDRARRQATTRLEALQRQLPGTVARVHPDGSHLDWVTPEQLQTDDRVQVDAGMAFPVDGILDQGQTDVDEALLTGESRPLPRGSGERVRAGSINLTAPVRLRVTRVAADSTLGQIRQLVDAAAAARPDWMRTADRWATAFLSGILVLAALSWFAWQAIDPAHALSVTIAILIVTCPCALSLATPSAMLSATAALARRGIWLRSPESLEALATAERVVFDKTGTLTRGRPTLQHIEPLRPGVIPGLALTHAAALAQWSQHPLSRALVQAAAPTDAPLLATDVTETAGGGVTGSLHGQPWRLGSRQWSGVTAHDLQPPSAPLAGWPATWLTDARGPVAEFRFDDPLRRDAAGTVAGLQRQGLQTALLSGDHRTAVERVAAELQLDYVQAELDPDAKLAQVQHWQRMGERVIMAGDGINDGPALAAADVAVVLGDATPLARGQADVVLASGQLADLTTARAGARAAVRVMRQNLVWALTYNVCSVPLAMLGYMPPWAAGLGMALSSLLVIGNGMRLLRPSARTARPGPAPATSATS